MRTTQRLRNISGAALLVGGLLLVPAIPAPAAAQTGQTEAATDRAMTSDQQLVADQINRTRTNHGGRALPTNKTMNNRAQAWAVHLVQCQCLQHRNPPFGTPREWYAAAENVGRSGDGGTLAAVHRAFLRSGGHRDNIVKARWTTMGVGVAHDLRGEYFVVHAFADRTR